MKLKKGDTVKVISGKDKGQAGRDRPRLPVRQQGARQRHQHRQEALEGPQGATSRAASSTATCRSTPAT
jgi:ribosomal protein L24